MFSRIGRELVNDQRELLRGGPIDDDASANVQLIREAGNLPFQNFGEWRSFPRGLREETKRNHLQLTAALSATKCARKQRIATAWSG
jgi:hypothetical protein